MKVSTSLAKLAENGWASALVRTATRLCLKFRPYALRVDVPPNGVIETSVGVVQGFMLLAPKASHVELQLAGVALTWVQMERNDAKRLYGHYVRGFRAITNLDQLRLVRLA